MNRPDNGGTMPSKSTPFTPSSILFRPRRCSRCACRLSALADFQARGPLHGWRRRVLPPGPIGLLRRPFIAIAGLRRRTQYRGARLTKKDQPGGGEDGVPCQGVAVQASAACLPASSGCELLDQSHTRSRRCRCASEICKTTMPQRPARFGTKTLAGDSRRPLR